MREDLFKELRAYGASLRSAVDRDAAHRAVGRAVANAPTRSLLRHRLVAVAATVVTFVTGNVGLAMAADSAVPGDFLYGIDRAYERLGGVIGLGSDHSAERLDEARVLAERGESELAIQTATDTFDALVDDHGDIGTVEDGTDEALASLEEAKDLLGEIGDAPGQTLTEDVRERTDELLELAQQVAAAAQNNDLELLKTLTRQFREIAKSISTPPGLSDEHQSPGLDDEFIPPGQGGEPPGQSKDKDKGKDKDKDKDGD